MKNTQKFLILISTVVLLNCNSDSIKAQSDETNKTQIEQVHTYFEELKVFLKKENGKLWNYQLYGPILLVNQSDRSLIANEDDNKGILVKNEEVYTGTLPNEIIIANTAFDWNGKRWTMVIMPLPKDYNERLNLLTHELFHRIQPEIGFAGLFENQNNHLDEKNGRIYLKLELEALKKAVSSNSGDERLKHIHNSLMFRCYRYLLFPDSKDSENTLELNEGLAEYTGSILSDRTDNELTEHYIQAINDFYKTQTFVRSFAYVTIPVYGYLMNLQDPGWNKKITINTNLTDFILEFFNTTIPEDLRDIVKKIEMNYNYDNITIFETKRDNERLKLITEYEIKFLKNPTLSIQFENMKIGFNPSNIMPLKDLGTVYPNLRITDNWGILTVENGALLSSNWDKVTVSEPTKISDEIIKGDGWKLELNNDWELIKIEENYILKKK